MRSRCLAIFAAAHAAAVLVLFGAAPTPASLEVAAPHEHAYHIHEHSHAGSTHTHGHAHDHTPLASLPEEAAVSGDARDVPAPSDDHHCCNTCSQHSSHAQTANAPAPSRAPDSRAGAAAPTPEQPAFALRNLVRLSRAPPARAGPTAQVEQVRTVVLLT